MTARFSFIIVLCAALVTCLAAIAVEQEAELISKQDSGENAAKTVLITGANRGLGLEFARQYSAAGYTVIGTARKPENAKELNELKVQVQQLDVADAESVAALVKNLEGVSIDMLINNAGIGIGAASFEDTKIEDVERVLQVNTLGPMRVTKALLENLKSGEGKIVVNITSGLGSIANNNSGRFYGYRESKAALNIFTRSIAMELKKEGFICIVMSPGWVRTDMGGPSANLSPEESITGMRSVIDNLKAEDTGKFWRYNGKQMPW